MFICVRRIGIAKFLTNTVTQSVRVICLSFASQFLRRLIAERNAPIYGITYQRMAD